MNGDVAKAPIGFFAVVAALICIAFVGRPEGAGRAAPGAPGGIIYVDVQAWGANDGSSWADAFSDLQLALAAASNPAEIWVSQGLYPTAHGTGRERPSC